MGAVGWSGDEGKTIVEWAAGTGNPYLIVPNLYL